MSEALTLTCADIANTKKLTSMILPFLAEAAAGGVTGSFTLGMAGLGSGIGIGLVERRKLRLWDATPAPSDAC